VIEYPKPEWATMQLVRETGLVEDVCEHGVGHPNRHYLRTHPWASEVHGCDGCCSRDYSEGAGSGTPGTPS